MFTRKQYMSNEVTHAEYYNQFVIDLIPLVRGAIGEDRIKASRDPYFNDIPLRRWDFLAALIPAETQRKIAEANGSGGISLSDKVCALKAAARLIKEEG